MSDFDPNAFLAKSQAASPPPQQPTGAAPPSMGSGFDPHQFLNEAPSIDDNTGEELPPEYNGRTPETAMNKSPLSALDRFKLSAGNQAGNIDYLKKRFDAVQPIMDQEGKPTSELAVMEHGKWSRVDADNGFEITDPWKLAKSYIQNPAELVGDIADIAPMIAGGAAALVAAPAAAGVAAAVGTAALVGGATAAVRTSLGRVVGTYDATPEEQAWDIGFETLLNAAGTAIPLGVKPGARYIAEKLPIIAKAYEGAVDLGGGAADLAKAGFKKVFSALSVGEDNFDTMVAHPFKVQATMKAASQKAGGNVSAYHDEIAGSQIEQVKQIAQQARGTLTQIYGKMKDKLLQSVPENFSANYDDAITSSYSGALEKGIGKLVLDDGTVKTEAEAVKHLAKNGLTGAKFKLLDQIEMKNLIQDGNPFKDELGYLGVDKDAYTAVAGYFEDLAGFAGAKKSTGKEAASNLLNFKKFASDRALAIQNMEKVRDIPNVRFMINQSRTAVDSAIHNGLKEAGVAGQFAEMNGTYAKLAEKFSPLLNANYRFEKSGDPKVYESLLNQFLSKPGKQVTNRFAVDAAIDAAEEHGLGSLAKSLSNSKLRVQIGEAAKAFNPLPSESKRRMAQIGLTTVAGSLATGNVGVAGAVGAGMALRSPLTAKAGVALTQGAFKGQQMLSSMSKTQVANFMSSPRALMTYTNAIMQAPQVRLATEDKLYQQMTGGKPPGTGQ